MSRMREQCPECGEELEVVNIAPCDDCGWDPKEIEHFNSSKHTYARYEVYGSILMLCNFCDVDFSSYNPEYWGFPKGYELGFGSAGFKKIANIPNEQLSISKGKYCPKCCARLPFIQAVQKARTRSSRILSE